MKSDAEPSARIDRLIAALKHKPFILTRQTPLDRRHADRLLTLKCVRCKSQADVTCVVRSPMALFLLCASCGDHWSVRKPGVVLIAAGG
jgi:transcription elongation factor Elf1